MAREFNATESSYRYFGWRVAAVSVVGIAFSTVPVMIAILSVLGRGIELEFGIGRAQVSLLMVFYTIPTIIFLPIFGRVIDKVGLRVVLLTSIVSSSAVVFAMAYLARNFFDLCVLSAVLGLVGTGAQPITYNKLMGAWFDKKRGLVMGIVAAGFGVGYSILPPIISTATRGGGWRDGMIVLAILTLLPLLLNYIWAIFPQQRDTVKPESLLTGATLQEALSRPLYWFLALAILLVSIVTGAISTHSVGLGRDLHLEPGRAILLPSILGMGTLAARLCVGYLYDKIFAPWVAAACLALAASGFALLALAANGSIDSNIAMVAIVLISIGYGAESDLVGFLASRYFGLRNFGQIYGTLYAMVFVGAAVGAPLFGAGHDKYGNYTLVLAASCVATLTGAAIIAFMPRYAAATHTALDAAETAKVDGYEEARA
jgi:MFS family permease